MPSVGGIPSVTEILAAAGLTDSYGFLASDKRAEAMAKGTALHAAIRLHAEGVLDEGSLHEAIRPGFDAYLEFVAAHRHVPHYSELELVSKRYGVCGHLDRVGPVDGHFAIVDFKCSDAPDLAGARLQTAAYSILWEESALGPPATRCYVVALGKTGKPKLFDVTDPYSQQVFLAALMVHRWKKENGR